MLFRNGAVIEELLHQLVLALGNDFHQLVMGRFGSRLQLGGNRTFFAFAVAAHLVGVGLHGDQIYYACQALFAANGNLHRNDLAAKGVAQAFQGILIIGALAVHAADHDHARQFDLFRILPNLFSNHLHAGDAVHHHDCRLSSSHGNPGLMCEQGEAGRIEQGDLGIAPLQ